VSASEGVLDLTTTLPPGDGSPRMTYRQLFMCRTQRWASLSSRRCPTGGTDVCVEPYCCGSSESDQVQLVDCPEVVGLQEDVRGMTLAVEIVRVGSSCKKWI
jgi:hypothetical protein